MSNIDAALQTICFIEEHLHEKLSLQDLADQAGFSQYHFHRLFTKTTGYSPYDYYLSRKLTRAVEHLSATHSKVIDTALEYGFNSPESFTRACLSVFGYSPSTIRHMIQAKQFVGVPKLKAAFLYYIQKREATPPRLLDMPELVLYGIGYLSETDQDYTKLPPQLNDYFRAYLEQGTDLYKIRWTLQKGEPENIRFIGTSTNTNNLMTKQLPATTYLAFDLYEDNAMLQEYIYSYYLPGSPYQASLPYSIELFPHENASVHSLDRSEISETSGARVGVLYIPVSLR